MAQDNPINREFLMVHENFLSTDKSRFLEPPGEKQIGLRNQEFEKLKVTSNYA